MEPGTERAPRTTSALRRAIVVVSVLVVFATGLALGSTLPGSDSDADADAAAAPTTSTTLDDTRDETGDETGDETSEEQADASSTDDAASAETTDTADGTGPSDSSDPEASPVAPTPGGQDPAPQGSSPAPTTPNSPGPTTPPADSPGPSEPAPGPSTPPSTDLPQHIPPPGGEQGPGGPTLIIPTVPPGLFSPSLSFPEHIHLGNATQTTITITNTGMFAAAWTPGPSDPGVSWNTSGTTIPTGGSVTVTVTVSGVSGNWNRHTSISYGGADHPILLQGGNILNVPTIPLDHLYP